MPAGGAPPHLLYRRSSGGPRGRVAGLRPHGLGVAVLQLKISYDNPRCAQTLWIVPWRQKGPWLRTTDRLSEAHPPGHVQDVLVHQTIV